MIDHKTASLADKITIIGELEHVYHHAKKSAIASFEKPEDEMFYQSVAAMAKNLRRDFMRNNFPNCSETDWCLGKAVETVRQRAYESDDGDTELLTQVDGLWAMIWNRITGQDVSGCSACKDDAGKIKDEDWGASSQESDQPDV